MQTYINTTEGANSAIVDLVRQMKSGELRNIAGLDLETAPILGLVGYPGSEVDEEGKTIKAQKKTYLEFAQKVWRTNFNPTKLQGLGLYLPVKTTAGKEGEVTAAEAWQHFLARLYELESTPEGRAQLEAARWTEQDLARASMAIWKDLENIDCHDEIELTTKLETLRATGKKGVKTLEQQLKKLRKQRETLREEVRFLDEVAEPMLKAPLDLRLASHVVKVGVEGRIYIDGKRGTNRLDPVQPGLDPYTSTVFLVQFTFVRKDTGEKLDYIFNTHKVDIKCLLPLLKLKNVTFIGANIKFDLKMLMHHAGYAPQKVHCTRVASRMLYLGLKMGHSLADVAKRFIGFEMSKEVRNTFIGRRYEEPTAEQLEYAYTDTHILPDIYDAQMEKARGFEQEELVRDFCNLSWITAKWEYDGYGIDTEKWLSIAAGAAKDRDAIAAELEEMLLPAGYQATFSYMSTEEVREAILRCIESGLVDIAVELQRRLDAGEQVERKGYGTLVATPAEELVADPDSEEGGEDSRAGAVVRISQTKLVGELLGKLIDMEVRSLEKTARATLEREYRMSHGGEGHPFFQKYALWSKLSKQASTYGHRFLWYIHPLTLRIHPSFNIAGTDTARFSGAAPNFLNIPAAKEPGDPDFRGAFVAPEGHYLLGADYETMELRIAGDISGDPMVKKMVESGADAHGFTATNMFHILPTGVDEPKLVDEVYRRGSTEYNIKIWQIPAGWTPEQVADFALSQEGTSAVLAVKKTYGKDITRGDAKSVTFLWLFQGTPFTLAERTGLPLDICEDLFRRFAGVYSVMDGHMKDLSESIHYNYIQGADGRKYGYSVGYNGIRRYVEVPENPNLRDYPNYVAYQIAAKAYKRELRRAQRQLCNLPMQGGNAVITCKALLQLTEQGGRAGVYPFLCIYDEIVSVAPDRVNPNTTKILLESAMLDSADPYMTFVRAGAEADVKKAGKHWVKS